MKSFLVKASWVIGFYIFWFFSALSAQTCKAQAINLCPLGLFLLQLPRVWEYLTLLLVGALIDKLMLAATGSSYSCTNYFYPFWAIGQWAFFIFLLDRFKFFHISKVSIFILGFVGGSIAVWTALKLEILVIPDNFSFKALAIGWGINLLVLKIIANKFLKQI